MNKNQKYFMKLQQYFTKEIFDKYDSLIYKIANMQHKTKDAVLNELGKVLLKYFIDNNYLSLENKDRTELKNKFENLINEQFLNEIKFETDFCDEIHNKIALDKYYSNSFIYSIGIDYTLKPVTDKTLKKIISEKIEGKNFSERIWDNKNLVAKQLKAEVFKFLDGKTDINSINNIIEKKFKANRYNSERLVKDSIGKVQERANEEWRRKHNINKVLWDATLDFKTCSDCGHLDGKVFNTDDAPQQHILCRCTLISLVDENWRPSKRLNNVTKKRIDWQTFEEWAKENKIKGF